MNMMKNVLFLVLAITFSLGTLFSQENVGIGTTSPHSSALLDLESNSKGLLIPRVELINVNNGTNPVNGPATGLLVYNESGVLTEGFYYWDGTQWVMVGAGGGTEECVSLDEAYNCGGAGVGRFINADAGAVEITLPATAVGDFALDVLSNKGQLASPTAAVWVEHAEHGAGIVSFQSNQNNLYSAIEATSISSYTGSENLPTAISGYHDGTGIGVGVWGETSSNSTAGSSYGVYGISTGNGNGFGGYFWSNTFPGVFAETNNPGSPAMQFAAAGQNPLNPGIVAIGSTQITCGNSGTPNQGEHVFFNNIAGEATIGPDFGGWGFLGGPTLEWWAIYTSNPVQVSRRDVKRDINYLDEDISEFIMNDIQSLKPALYKYKSENDEIVPNMEQRTRYNKRLGFMLDETPDYIQDNSFSGIDLYSLTSLSIAGVQHNRQSILNIEEKLETISMQINDFGVASINGNEVRVDFSKDFKGNIPVVSVTPNSPVANYYIKSQDENGFTLAVNGSENFQFNWIAMANHTVEKKSSEPKYNINPSLMSQLRVDEAKKQHLHSLLYRTQNEPLKLKGTSDKRPLPLRSQRLKNDQ